MIPAIPSNYASAITPFSPLGREAVGQENLDLKSSSLKPLEPSAESFRGENRRSPDERTGEDGERARLTRDEVEQGASGRPADNGRQQQLEEQREIREIRELAARDREVRMHEQAHAAIGGKYAGSPRYEYTRGPDGRSYAVAGEVSIDTSKVPNDPQATLEKASQIRRAANAPAEPSATDRRVAAEAARMEAEARAEILQEQLREVRERDSGAETNSVVEEGEAAPGRTESERSVEGPNRNVDLGRRLDDTGVNPNPFPVGRLLDQSA